MKTRNNTTVDNCPRCDDIVYMPDNQMYYVCDSTLDRIYLEKWGLDIITDDDVLDLLAGHSIMCKLMKHPLTGYYCDCRFNLLWIDEIEKYGLKMDVIQTYIVREFC